MNGLVRQMFLYFGILVRHDTMSVQSADGIRIAV